jgi:hypothetical protein
MRAEPVLSGSLIQTAWFSDSDAAGRHPAPK